MDETHRKERKKEERLTRCREHSIRKKKQGRKKPAHCTPVQNRESRKQRQHVKNFPDALHATLNRLLPLSRKRRKKKPHLKASLLSTSHPAMPRAAFAPPSATRIRGRAEGDDVTSVAPMAAPVDVPAVAPVAAAPIAAIDPNTTYHARDPGHFSWLHVTGNLAYLLVFAILVTTTVLMWIMYGKTHKKGPMPPVSTAPGSAFDRMLLTCGILSSVAIALTVFVLWYNRPGQVAYGHMIKYGAV
jgi:hypothetical protein